MLLHVLQLHATVHGYAGDVRVLQPNGMIAPGLPCGRAGRNHDNITLYSCDRPSPYCSRARICPGTGVNRLTFAPGQKSLSRYAISGHFREPGQDNPQSPHTPTNRIGGIQPIPKSTYCPRFSRRTIDVQTGATGIVPVREKHPFSQTRTVISVLVPTSND